jgi:hypothetical protein
MEPILRRWRETSPPNPLRGANIGFADIIFGAERGRVSEEKRADTVRFLRYAGCIMQAVRLTSGGTHMGLTVDWLGIDCADPAALARFWAEALAYRIEDSDDPDEVPIGPKDGPGTRILFLRVPEEKTIKNRFHLDLRPDDQQAEVARLEALGARKIDIGQGVQTWVVMADPEGNEFCILRNLTAEERARRGNA